MAVTGAPWLMLGAHSGLDQQTVAGGFDDAAMVLGDFRRV
jgi:hypothetical protein